MKALVTLLACVALIGTASAADVAAGAAKAKEVCTACHGVDGNSADVNNPRLAGQYPDYLAKALRDYKSGERKHPSMRGIAVSLSDKDMADLAAYYAEAK